MKKVISVFIVVIVLFAMTGYASADIFNRGRANHLTLHEKDPVTWEIVRGGAEGHLIYVGNKFVFVGHRLAPNTDYTLIKYNGNDWPTAVCMSSRTSNRGGNVHMRGRLADYGDKVWLVKSEDVNCGTGEMIDWNPTEYLFEHHLI